MAPRTQATELSLGASPARLAAEWAIALSRWAVLVCAVGDLGRLLTSTRPRWQMSADRGAPSPTRPWQAHALLMGSLEEKVLSLIPTKG